MGKLEASGRQPILPACLIILDGFGLDSKSPVNAISLASTPNIDAFLKDATCTLLEASGEAVGLPEGQMGNSEVGHLNIGAGRVVNQELTRINRACRDGSLESNEVLRTAFASASENGKVVHLMGLVSDGGVHSSIEHLYALVEAAKANGVKNVYVHCFLDGRDVPPESGAGFIGELQDFLDKSSSDGFDAKIASISGRYYAMDRDNRWDRVEKAYDTIVDAQNRSAVDPVGYIEDSYSNGVTDEFVVPASFQDRRMADGDSVVFFNFRPDRAREITRSIVDAGFDHFKRSRDPKVTFVCLTEYDPTIEADVAFAKSFPANVLADVLSDAGLSQYHIAETEKYAHVTFFLNGGIEEEKKGEERVLIASPKVATYDMQPEMSAPEVTKTLVDAIDSSKADVYIVNFANCDMVGHTGDMNAAIKAVEAVDDGVGQIVNAIKSKRGCILLTADHGNADRMVGEDGEPFTSHTTALVPFAFKDYSEGARGLRAGITLELGTSFDSDSKHGPVVEEDLSLRLADIAPTLLDAICIEQPAEMTGRSLLE